MQYRKEYVEVFVRVDVEGQLFPVAFMWDGRRFTVEKTLDRRLSPPQHVGGALTELFVCRVDGREHAFYRETQSGRWFVERRIG